MAHSAARSSRFVAAALVVAAVCAGLFIGLTDRSAQETHPPPSASGVNTATESPPGGGSAEEPPADSGGEPIPSLEPELPNSTVRAPPPLPTRPVPAADTRLDAGPWPPPPPIIDADRPVRAGGHGTEHRRPRSAADPQATEPGPLLIRVFDADTGDPLPAVSLEARTARSAVFLGQTDAAGQLLATRHPAADFALLVHADGCVPMRRSVREVAADEQAVVDVLLARGVRIEGVVLHEGGRPVAEGWARLSVVTMERTPHGTEVEFERRVAPVARAYADPDGRFILDAAPRGSRVILEVGAGPRLYEHHELLVPHDVRQTLRGGVLVAASAGPGTDARETVATHPHVSEIPRALVTLRLALPAGADEPRGYRVDAGLVGLRHGYRGGRDWRPLRRFEHATAAAGTERSTWRGGVVEIGGVPVGRSFVSVVVAGYRLVTRFVDVPRDGLDLGVVSLEPVRYVRGLVLDADGAPVSGALVSADVDEPLPEARVIPPFETTSDASGGFRIPLPVDAIMQVRAWAPGFRPGIDAYSSRSLRREFRVVLQEAE